MSKSGEFRMSDLDACINSDTDEDVPPPPPRPDTPGPSSGITLGNLEAETDKVKTGIKSNLSEAKIKALTAAKAVEAQIKAMEVDDEGLLNEASPEEKSKGEFLLLKDGTMVKEVDSTSFGKFFHHSLEALFKVLRPFTEIPEDEKEKGIIKLAPVKKDKMVEDIRKVSETEIKRLLSAILLDRGLKFRTKGKNKKVESSDNTADKTGEVKQPEITSKAVMSTSTPAIPQSCLCSALHDLIMSCPVNGANHGALCAGTSKRSNRKRKLSVSPAPKAKAAKPEPKKELSGTTREVLSGRGRGQVRGRGSRGKEGPSFSRGGKRGGFQSVSDRSRTYAQVVKEKSKPLESCSQNETTGEWSEKDKARFGKQRKESPTAEKLKEIQRLQDLGLAKVVRHQAPSATITSDPSSDNIPSKEQFERLMSHAGQDSASSISLTGPSNLPRIPKFPKGGKHGDKAVDSKGNIQWSTIPQKPANLPANIKFEVTVEGGFWHVKYVQ